jgi:uncharacterized protein YhbP (UPF0306 family)
MAIDVEQTVREYIQKTVHMSLGTARDNQPWVCEVHFAYDDDLNLYFRSKPSRRHSQEIKDNPRVAGNIVKQHNLDESVVGVYYEGSAEMISHIDADSPAYKSLSARLNLKPESLDEANEEDGHKFYKVSIQSWYVFGRFGGDSGQKHQLAWNGGLNREDLG